MAGFSDFETRPCSETWDVRTGYAPICLCGACWVHWLYHGVGSWRKGVSRFSHVQIGSLLGVGGGQRLLRGYVAELLRGVLQPGHRLPAGDLRHLLGGQMFVATFCFSFGGGTGCEKVAEMQKSVKPSACSNAHVPNKSST